MFQWKHKRHETILTWWMKRFYILEDESQRYFKLGNYVAAVCHTMLFLCCPLPEPQCCSSAGAALLCVEEHVQSDPGLQAEGDAPWELHGEDSGHLARWERILDRAHVLLRPGRK